MNLKDFISELIARKPRQIIIISSLLILVLLIILGVIKYNSSYGIVNENVHNFLIVTCITLSIVIFTINISFLKIIKMQNIAIGIDGDEKRSYNSVLEDLKISLNKASKSDKILNVQVTNLGVRLKTQQKSFNFDTYIRLLNDGIKSNNIFCQFLFLAYDNKSAERIINEAKNFEGYESYEIKVIIDNVAPILPIYNIYVFGDYAAKLSIENPSNHIITVHSTYNQEKVSIARIQKLFNHSWSIENAHFLLKNGVILSKTLTKLETVFVN